MNILSFNIPPQNVLTAVCIVGVVLYADKKIDACEEISGKYAFPERLMQIFSADDYSALRGICRMKCAFEDILGADYSHPPCDTSFGHIRDVFTPVMPPSCKGAFSAFADTYHRATKAAGTLSGSFPGGLTGMFSPLFSPQTSPSANMPPSASVSSLFSCGESDEGDECGKNEGDICGCDEIQHKEYPCPEEENGEFEDILELIRMMKQ